MKPALFACLLMLFIGCNNQEQAPAPENDLDAARTFIQLALEGKYDQARQLMLRDSLNDEWMDNIERNYETKMNREDKRGYREATIRFFETIRPSDTLSIVNYANTYKNERNVLKLVKLDKTWKVDLKYSFFPPDSTQKNPNVNNSK